MPSKNSSLSLAAAFKAGVTGKTTNNGNVSENDAAQIFYAQLHGKTIARRDDETLEICHSGWVTSTTASRLNAILSAFGILGKVSRKGGKMFYEDKEVPVTFGNLSFSISKMGVNP